jgi:hypothetical protein
MDCPRSTFECREREIDDKFDRRSVESVVEYGIILADVVVRPYPVHTSSYVT